MATGLSISSPFICIFSNLGPKFLRKRVKFSLGNKHKAFGELEPKTYPQRTKGLKYSSMFPQGEMNLLMEPPICSRTHMVPQNWSPNLVAWGTKGIQIHNQVALGRTGLGKSNQGGPEKKGLGCLGESWFSAKRRGCFALWRLVWELRMGLSPNQVAS
jgi:hypothetical protein